MFFGRDQTKFKNHVCPIQKGSKHRTTIPTNVREEENKAPRTKIIHEGISTRSEQILSIFNHRRPVSSSDYQTLQPQTDPFERFLIREDRSGTMEGTELETPQQSNAHEELSMYPPPSYVSGKYRILFDHKESVIYSVL